jgi:hypothetical protein
VAVAKGTTRVAGANSTAVRKTVAVIAEAHPNADFAVVADAVSRARVPKG